MAMRPAINATTVLPEPTSPCIRRFMGCGSVIPFFISEITLSCAAVNLNGSMFLKFSTMGADFKSAPTLNAIPFSFSLFPFFKASPISRQNNSSKTRLFLGSQSFDSIALN